MQIYIKAEFSLVYDVPIAKATRKAATMYRRLCAGERWEMRKKPLPRPPAPIVAGTDPRAFLFIALKKCSD